MEGGYFLIFFNWLSTHQQLIFIAAFIAAFVESFAVIGILVPGIAILFGIAVVAANSDVALMMLLFSAFAGAVTGDCTSFFLGLHFHEKLRRFPPFTTHPQWIEKGERYFIKHGAISIVIGRFVGPLRPMMPLVAGMFQMSPFKFLTINLLSGLAWAPIYIIPGYLVGTSLDESYGLQRQHTFFVIAIALFIWLINQLIRSGLRSSQRLSNYIKITRPESVLMQWGLSRISVLSLSTLFFCSTAFIALAICVKLGLLNNFNQWVHNWFLTIRHPWVDPFFIVLTELGDMKPMTLTGLFLVVFFLAQRWWTTAFLWLAVLASSPFIIFGLKDFFGVARPVSIVTPPTSLAFPSGHTAIITLLGGFMTLVLLRYALNKFHNKIIQISVAVITLIAISRLYLGVHWLSDIVGGLLLGCAILGLSQFIYYRLPEKSISTSRASIGIAMAFLLSMGVYVIPNYQQSLLKFSPLQPELMNPAYQRKNTTEIAIPESTTTENFFIDSTLTH